MHGKVRATAAICTNLCPSTSDSSGPPTFPGWTGSQPVHIYQSSLHIVLLTAYRDSKPRLAPVALDKDSSV